MADKKSSFNVNAVEFVPRFGAASFVPGQKVHVVPPELEPSLSTPLPTPTGDSPTPIEDPPAEDPSVTLANGVKGEPLASEAIKELDTEGEVDDWELNDEPMDDEDDVAETKPRKKIKAETDEDVVKKEHVNVIFIGHVDAGKSTIGGHIMFLTGMVDKRTLEKYEKEAKEKNRESWYLSWALDTNQEERDKGKTVEVGRAFFETETKHFTILDAPGHKSFVPNMIGGASQADLAVLVISARKGEFETGFERGGQTSEHAMLAKTAGVKHLVILVNKMDDPTVLWDEQRFTEIKERLTPYLKKLGFNPKTDIFYIPCSGLTGAFLKEAPGADVCDWYSGPSFIPYLDSLPAISRAREGPVRIVLVDKYDDMGTIVLGKVESGTVAKKDTLLLMPNRTNVTVLQIWSDEEEADSVEPGENIKLKIKGVEEEDVLGGFVLCSTNSPCKYGRIFDAQVIILESKSIIAPGFTAVLHIHAASEDVTIKMIMCLVDRKGEKSKTRPRFVKQDQIAIMRLEASENFCMEAYKDFPQMGRFTLRDEGRTIAIGKVLKVLE